MPIFNWFKKDKSGKSNFPGKRLSIDEILKMDNATSMIIELSYGLSDKISRSGYESLSHPEKVLNSVYWLETEINNGGFEQYFYNSSGNYAIDTPSALEEIRANQTAKIVKEANSFFPSGSPSKDRNERISFLEQVAEETLDKWEELDSQFLQYQDPLEELQINYLKQNKHQINLKS